MPRTRLRPQPDPPEELSVWTSFTDLMSNAFMILSLFLLLSFTLYASVSQNTKSTVANLAKLEKENKELKNQLNALKSQYKDAALGTPPIIIIPDNPKFRFASGSAALSQPLRAYIWSDLWKSINENFKEYKINTVEIIGHTDGQPNTGSTSNLDRNLESAAINNRITSLSPGSNADLGLMRALAIANELRQIQRQRNELLGLQFRAYSAAQLYQVDGRLAQPNRGSESMRRRIEVRFTKLGVQQVAN